MGKKINEKKVLKSVKKHIKAASKKPRKIEGFDEILLGKHYFAAMTELESLAKVMGTEFKNEKQVEELFVLNNTMLEKHLTAFDKFKKNYSHIPTFCSFVVNAHNNNEQAVKFFESFKNLNVNINFDVYGKNFDRVKDAEKLLLKKAEHYLEKKHYTASNFYFDAALQMGLLDENGQKTAKFVKGASHFVWGQSHFKDKMYKYASEAFKLALDNGYDCLKEFRQSMELYYLKRAEYYEEYVRIAVGPLDVTKRATLGIKMYTEANKFAPVPDKYNKKIEALLKRKQDVKIAVKDFFKELGEEILFGLIDPITTEVVYEDDDYLVEKVDGNLHFYEYEYYDSDGRKI